MVHNLRPSNIIQNIQLGGCMSIHQGCTTCIFLKPSVLSILAEVEDKFDAKALFSSIFIKFGLRKDFEWPTQCFLEPSVTMILILVQKVANRRLISGEDLFFLEITIILVQKVANWRLISGEDLFF